MDLTELEEELDSLFPGGFTIEYDSHGQVVINTGLKVDEDENLVPLDSEEDVETDPDLEPLDDED